MLNYHVFNFASNVVVALLSRDVAVFGDYLAPAGFAFAISPTPIAATTTNGKHIFSPTPYFTL
jgi:hypothetical protein